jgi:xylulokinase
MWLKEHEPNIWKNADKFLLYEDYVIHKMTGVARISHCLASRTQMYDTHRQSWSQQILTYLDISQEHLAQMQPSGTPVRRMQEDLAASLGFGRPPLVVTGGHDQACGALGVGLTKAGLAMVSTGSAEVVEVVMDSPTLNGQLFQGNISVYSHTVPEMYLSMTLNHSGGMVLRWFRDNLAEVEIKRAAVEGVDAYDLLLRDISPDPSGLLLLPHFSGSGTPTFDTESKAAILGLNFATTKTDLLKAVLEGLTFELRVNLEVLQNGGVEITELRAIGGGAKSPYWLQLKADITGIPVVVPRITEAACWGAALCAGAGAGVYKNLAQTAHDSVVLVDQYTPDHSRFNQYAELYGLYTELYPTIKDLLHQI